MTRIKAAVFASGTGSNFQALMDEKDLACEIVLMVCDQQNASVIEKAANHKVPTFIFNPKAYASKVAYENQLVQKLQELNVSWIFLAGYMRIVGPTLLQAFENKIVNIHPSLLPAFPGKDAIGQAFQAGTRTTGVTVHLIDDGVDTGPIITQESVAVLPDDSIDTLKMRIQKTEHRLYPKVINHLLQ